MLRRSRPCITLYRAVACSLHSHAPLAATMADMGASSASLPPQTAVGIAQGQEAAALVDLHKTEDDVYLEDDLDELLLSLPEHDLDAQNYLAGPSSLRLRKEPPRRSVEVVEISDDEEVTPFPAAHVSLNSSRCVSLHASHHAREGRRITPRSSPETSRRPVHEPGIEWLERRWKVRGSSSFGNELHMNGPARGRAKAPTLSRPYSTKPTPDSSKKVKSLFEEVMALTKSILGPAQSYELSKKPSGSSVTSKQSLYASKRRAAAQREEERQSLEKGLEPYSYLRPAGFIASMKRRETEQDSNERQAEATNGSSSGLEKSTHASPELFLASTVEDIDKALAPIANGTPLSFDMEWPAVFRSGGVSKTGLIQIAAPSRIVVCQVGHLKSLPSQIIRLVEDVDTIKCGVAIAGDFTKLRRDFGQSITPRNVVELSSLAKLAEPKRWMGRSTYISLRDLTRIYLQRRLDKDSDVRMSNWSINVLTQKQIEYAASDVYVGLEILYSLTTRIEEEKRNSESADKPPSYFPASDVSKALGESRLDVLVGPPVPVDVEQTFPMMRSEEIDVVGDHFIDPNTAAGPSNESTKSGKRPRVTLPSKRPSKEAAIGKEPFRTVTLPKEISQADSPSKEAQKPESVSNEPNQSKTAQDEMLKADANRDPSSQEETPEPTRPIDTVDTQESTKKRGAALKKARKTASSTAKTSELREAGDVELYRTSKYGARHYKALSLFRSGLDFDAVGARMRSPALKRETIATYIISTKRYGGSKLTAEEVARFSKEMDTGMSLIRKVYGSYLQEIGVLHLKGPQEKKKSSGNPNHQDSSDADSSSDSSSDDSSSSPQTKEKRAAIPPPVAMESDASSASQHL